MVVKTEVKINNIDVTSFVINYNYEDTYGDAISMAEIKVLRSISTVLTVQTGQTVVIKRGWTTPTDETIFQGYIESFNPEGGTIKIVARNKMWDLIRKEITMIYDQDVSPSAGVISEIFKDIVTTYGGLNADSSSIQDSGLTITLDKFICNHADPFDRCKKLAEIMNWQFYYRSDTDKVYFEPLGFVSNPTILTVGDNVIAVPKWKYDNTEMVNDLTVAGAYSDIQTTETGRVGTTPGYTTTSVQLAFTPISTKVYWDAANPPTTLRVGGVPGSSTTYDYSVDYNKKQIIPKNPITSAWYVQTLYSHAVPVPINMWNQVSIDSYGRFTKTVTFTDIKTITDAEYRGKNYLAQYSRPFIYTTLNVKSNATYNIHVGDMIRVVDNISIPHLDQLLVVNRHIIRYPGDYEEVYVGDKQWRLAAWQASVEEKLKRFLEDQLQNQDILTRLSTIIHDVNVKQRYFKASTLAITGDALVWGHPYFGVWNSYKWSANAYQSFVLGHPASGVLGTDRLGNQTSAEIIVRIMWPNNIYIETFKDTIFDGGGAGVWDTTAKTLTIAAGTRDSLKIWQNAIPTSALMTVTYTGGAPTLYLSANNGLTWESVTNGTSHTFTNADDSGVKWRITGNATVISNIQVQVIE